MFQAIFHNTITNQGNLLYQSKWTIENSSLLELNKILDDYPKYWKNQNYNTDLIKVNEGNVLFTLEAWKIECGDSLIRTIKVVKL